MYVLISINILKFKLKLNLKFMLKGSKTMKRMKRSKRRRQLTQVKAILLHNIATQVKAILLVCI